MVPVAGKEEFRVKRRVFIVCAASVLLLNVGVSAPALAGTADSRAIAEGKASVPSADWQREKLPARATKPEQLKYMGAFNMPKDGGGSGHLSWPHAGSFSGLTYCPKGDSKGAGDGFPGSLFGTTHPSTHAISEISIPVPKIPKKKSHTGLNYAKTLQPFKSISARVVTKGGGKWGMRLRGIGYMSARGKQDGDRIYFGGFRSYVSPKNWSRGSVSADLSKLKVDGLWQLEGQGAYNGVADLMEIPKEWADKHCDGMYLAWSGNILATGSPRYAIGRGPAVIATAPWRDGNPPKPGQRLKCKVLLQYGGYRCSKQEEIRDRQRADGWHGAAWTATGNRSAIVFFGIKDMGETYYGYAKTPEGYKVYDNDRRNPLPGTNGSRFVYKDFNGKVHPCHKVKGYRGYKPDFPKACIYLYDPNDLAKVAQGKMKPYEPQYYARLDVSKYMFQKRNTPRGCGYDRKNNLLYVLECRASGKLPVVHVWKIQSP